MFAEIFIAGPSHTRVLACKSVHVKFDREEFEVVRPISPQEMEPGVCPTGVSERMALIERICASSAFAKSPRLSAFLRYVVAARESGRAAELSEQRIGVEVFGRSADYNPVDDSIVRSHASRLRHRLQEYFDLYGKTESVQLRIPRGAYVPLFTDSLAVESETGDDLFKSPAAQEEQEQSETGESTESDERSAVRMESVSSAARKHRLQWTVAALVLLLAIVLAWSGYREWRQRSAEIPPALESHPLWGQFLSPSQHILVVQADSGAVILQGLTHRRISLSTYLSGDYLRNIHSPLINDAMLRDLALRRYTSAVDLRIIERLMRLFGVQNHLLESRFSRDLHPDDLKTGNVIVLGTYESTPWVQLYEPRMNFYFENNLDTGVFSIVNRNPRPGEQARYDCVSGDPNHTVYGVVAFQPGMNPANNVLILEGQSMAGTQTAADFVFDDSLLLPFLKKIQRHDGKIPHFELVLRSTSLGFQSSQLEPVTYRIDAD